MKRLFLILINVLFIKVLVASEVKFDNSGCNFSISDILIHQVSITKKSETAFLSFKESKSLFLDYTEQDIIVIWSDSLILENSGFEFAYKMEGYDMDWIQCGTDIKTRYTNLPAGQYRFRLKWSCDGIWNEEGDSFDLIITPAWWQTFYFKIMMMIIFLFILVNNFVLRSKIKKTDNF